MLPATPHRPAPHGQDVGVKAEGYLLKTNTASVDSRKPEQQERLRIPPRSLRSPPRPQRGFETIRPTGTERAAIALRGVDERQRLGRDLHDGVQNELVALIVKLALAEEDPETPPALAHTLAELEARAQAVLDSVRDIARGIYPPLLADFGLQDALRAQAMRVPISVRLTGSVPRSTRQAEEAVYFSCSEAIQNAAKHTGGTARVTLRLDYHDEVLRVWIADDGPGFDPARTPAGVGLQSIHDRIECLGGDVDVASRPGFGTVLTISLPCPAEANGRR